MLDCSQGLFEQAADDGVLEAGGQIKEVLRELTLGAEGGDELRGGAGGVGNVRAAVVGGGEEVMGLEMAEDGGFYPGEGEVQVPFGAWPRARVCLRRDVRGLRRRSLHCGVALRHLWLR